MYYLRVCPVGCDEDTLPTVRRELANCNAETKAEFPDVSRAIDHLWLDEGEVCLFIVQIASAEKLDDLKRLSGTFVGCPVMALVGEKNAPTLMLKTMRMGASQVVTLPLRAEDFREAMDCIALQTRTAAGRARTIAVSGTSGGCGCTTIAINLAYEVSFLRKTRCILLELALRRGSLADHLDIRPSYSMTDLLAEPDRLDSYLLQHALTNVTDDFSVLPGPYEAAASEVPDVNDVLKLVNLAKHLASEVFLDVPCLYDDLHFRALAAANEVILVVEQTVSSIRAASMICSTLGEQRPSLIVNRYNPKMEGFSAKRLRELLKPQSLWTVAKDDAVVTATNNGTPLRLEAPKSPALADLDRVVADLVPEGRGNGSRKTESTFLGRLTRALTLSHKD
ncbi:MAG: hypothetical protein JW888_04710 [Pirellulales bacterium]|nr:hypothetical protein [Pirellulales bacterium]